MNETIFGTRFVYGLSRADYIMNPNRLSALTIQSREHNIIVELCDTTRVCHRLRRVPTRAQRPTGTIAHLNVILLLLLLLYCCDASPL